MIQDVDFTAPDVSIRELAVAVGVWRFHISYCDNKGEADKQIEPYLIVFKWSDWYVFGFCKERQDFRMYKLRRLWDLQITDESFGVRDITEEQMQFGSHMTDDYVITVVCGASVKYR